MNELEDALRRAEEKLSEKDYAILKAVVDAYDTITELVDNKNTTIARLRKMLFGATTEKTAAVIGGKDRETSPAAEDNAEPASAIASGTEKAPESPRKGHGRNGADAYAAAEKVAVPHESLAAGDPCPKCERGTVYETARPGVLVRLVGQTPLRARIYELQKLRCNLCGVVFTARSPDGVGDEKCDATGGSMIALLKYGSGMPFHRLDVLQANLGVPLPASTQWDIVHAKVERIEPAYDELIRQAAAGEVVQNDDTTVKILEWMGKRGKQAAFAEESLEGSAEKMPADRRGMYTTGIVSTRPARASKIALFFSGENMPART